MEVILKIDGASLVQAEKFVKHVRTDALIKGICEAITAAANDEEDEGPVGSIEILDAIKRAYFAETGETMLGTAAIAVYRMAKGTVLFCNVFSD